MILSNVTGLAEIHRKITEWSESFIGWAKTLPYADELLFIKKRGKRITG